MSDTDIAEPTDVTDDTGDTAADAQTGTAAPADPPARLPDRRLRMAAAVIAAVAIAAGAVFGYLKYRDVTNELAALRQAQSDRDTAAQVAREYAVKSLTYSFEDPDAFFRAVEDNVAQPLKDKYVDVTDVLKQLVVDGQLTSSGEVLATDATAVPDGGYQVVVSATQTTRNLQRPTPRVSVILLQITVNKAGDGWQVSDIRRANTGGQASDQLPGPGPLTGEPAPKR